jgi:hypothetical protein
MEEGPANQMRQRLWNCFIDEHFEDEWDVL